jgi:hypothetical protein
MVWCHDVRIFPGQCFLSVVQIMPKIFRRLALPPSSAKRTSKESIQACIQKFPDWPPGVRTANVTALCH